MVCAGTHQGLLECCGECIKSILCPQKLRISPDPSTVASRSAWKCRFSRLGGIMVCRIVVETKSEGTRGHPRVSLDA